METPHRNLDEIIETFERNIIRKTLEDTLGNQSKAAKVLGISKRKIQYKIRKYGVDCKTFKGISPAGNDTVFSWHSSSSSMDRHGREDSLLLP